LKDGAPPNHITGQVTVPAATLHGLGR
jgi:hypothetical protein